LETNFRLFHIAFLETLAVQLALRKFMFW